jgi:uncharacterized protein (TIGR03032 family)
MANQSIECETQEEIQTGQDGLKQIAVSYEHSSNLAWVLSELKLSVLLSTYQAGKLVSIGSLADRPTFSFHSFDQVMGVAVSGNQIAVGSRRQVHFLTPAHELARHLPAEMAYDSCFLSRKSFITGSIHGHDLAFGNEGLWVVNTLFSCLCTLDDQYNFFPRWRPKFVSELIDQDRCHLNGLALENGVPKYVTVLGVTDEPAGWRANKRSGGALIDVESGDLVCDDLSMPHSPRVHQGRVFVLNSGCGELSTVDRSTGKIEAVARLPGYTRGLAFYGKYAFVGLSRIRETNVFGGLPIGEHPETLKCGLGIVDWTTGRTIATLSFQSGVEELFAVEVLSGVTNPKIQGPSPIQGEEDEIWVVPPLQIQTMAPRLPAMDANQSRPDARAVQGLLRESKEAIAVMVHRANELHAQGDLRGALELLHSAASIAPESPGSAELFNQLGNLYQEAGDQTTAIGFYQRAVHLDPAYAPAHQNLGMLSIVQNEPLRGLRHFELAQQSNPKAMNLILGAKVLPVIYDDVDQVQRWRARFETCVRALVDQNITIDTTNTLADTSFYLAYQGQNDRQIMSDLGKVYRGRLEVPGKTSKRPKGRKIKVGFLSAYFRDHTIGRLNLGRIRGLSRDDFEVTVLALHSSNDSMAQAFRQAADRYVVLKRQVQQARRTIEELGLDILIFADIGMDALTQSLCYSRMASIQASTWGHPDTSGSPAIDYFVSSALAEPDGAQNHYTEKLVELDNLGVYYERPKLHGSKRSKESFGIRADRTIYLCPQTAFKFHPAFDEALRGILHADQSGELLLIEGRVAAWTEALKRRWWRVMPEVMDRVRFLPSLPQPEFLHLLSVADVVLDPYPFCGGNTSYEAFAVGAPVVTYPGEYLRGRLTSAMYKRMGHEELVAASPEDYIRLAVGLGQDPTRNRKLRREISDAAGILFDNPDDITSWNRVLNHWIGELQ